MNNITRYIVISHNDEINICWEINRKLKDGWLLQGGIAVASNAGGEKMFYQAMTYVGQLNRIKTSTTDG